MTTRAGIERRIERLEANRPAIISIAMPGGGWIEVPALGLLAGLREVLRAAYERRYPKPSPVIEAFRVGEHPGTDVGKIFELGQVTLRQLEAGAFGQPREAKA